MATSTNPVYITEHVTTPSTVTSTAAVFSCNTSTITSVTYSSDKCGPRTRISTALGSTVKSTHVKVSPEKTLNDVSNSVSNYSGNIATLDSLTKQVANLEALLRHQSLYNLIQKNKIKDLEQEVSCLKGEPTKTKAWFSVRAMSLRL